MGCQVLGCGRRDVLRKGDCWLKMVWKRTAWTSKGNVSVRTQVKDLELELRKITVPTIFVKPCSYGNE